MRRLIDQYRFSAYICQPNERYQAETDSASVERLLRVVIAGAVLEAAERLPPAGRSVRCSASAGASAGASDSPMPDTPRTLNTNTL